MKSHQMLPVLFAALTGCEVDDGVSPIDAPVTVDVPVATVTVVSPCPPAPDATVTTIDSELQFMPALTTITGGQIVKFQTSLDHDVAPLPPMTDTSLVVGFNTSKCFRFAAAGTFKFKCTPHGFTGTITVNP